MTSPPATSSIPPPTSPAPSPRHDDPTGQAGAPAREGWRHPHVTRWSRVSNGGNAMNTTTVRTRFVLILALLVFATFAATSSTLACVVGTGTSASCTEAALDACLPGGGSFAGTVTFACGGAATITVTSAKTISADTTIDGGSVITISGSGNAVGVLSVNSGVTFTVENLTVTNGHTRGAITNGGTLTVTNCTFSGNSATSGGGAISGGGTVTNSTFSGNSATLGGAISNEGTLTVTNSILANSTSGGNCGVPAGITAIFTDGGA